jgi:ComF family protein
VQLQDTYLQHNNHNEQMFEHLIGFIAPHTCLICAKQGKLLCLPCAKTLERPSEICFLCHKAMSETGICAACLPCSSLSRISVATTYSSAGLQLIHRLKFSRATAASAIIAAQIFTYARLPEHAVITHAPTATSRRRQRGYDQAQCIARQLARLSGLPYAPLLARVGQQRQLGKTRIERMCQQPEAYRSKHIPLLQNRPIVLVDDVITTGSTLQASAATLLSAGAAKVEAFVFAAALPHLDSR